MLNNNTNAFKKGPFGLLRLVCALSMVAKIDSPATHQGTRWPPRK